LKEEEERRLEVEEDEMLFTYTREDAFNQVKKSVKKSKSVGAKAKTPSRTLSGRRKSVKKKDENFVIDEDKRRSDQNLSDHNFEKIPKTPKLVRPVGRPAKNKTPKPTPKAAAKGRKSSKIDVETVDEVQNETPKQNKSKRRQSKGSPKASTDEKANASKLVSKILAAQANQKAAISSPQSNLASIQQQQQTTYSQQLLAQSQKAGLTKAQLASTIQKIQSPNLSKPTLQPQLLSASQLQHLKQIISSAHRNITPGQPNTGVLPQQTLQPGQTYIPQSPVKSATLQNAAAPVQQLFFQHSPTQQGQFVISQGQNMVPQIITQQQISQMQQIQGTQTVVTPSFVQVQGRGGVTPTLLQIQGSQPGAPPSLVQIQQPQNIPAFLQIQGSQMQSGSTPLIQVQGSQQASRQVQVQGTKTAVPTTQVLHFQTSPSALLAQIQASRVHGSSQQVQASRTHSSQSVLSATQRAHPTIVQATQGTQLVIPPSNMSLAKQSVVKSSQLPGYVPTTPTSAITQVKISSITTPSIINVQNMPQQIAKLTTNKIAPTQYATVQDIQLVVSNASNIPKVVGSQVVTKTSPAIQQTRATTPQQNIQVVKSQVSLSGGSLQQSKQTSIPQTLQQVITQNSAGQPVLSFIRMAGNQNTTQPQQNIVQFVNPSASASPRPQASQQQGMVYLQLAGGKAIPVSLASSQMTMPVVKADGTKGQAIAKARNVVPTLVVSQGNAIQLANGPAVTSSRINSPVSRFQVAGNIGHVARLSQPRIRSPLVNPGTTSARPVIATVGMAARQPPVDNTPTTVPPPWNNPNLVIRTRRAAVQEACKTGVENGEIPVVQNQIVSVKSPQVVSNVTINMVDSTNHIPGANVEYKNGCVTTEVKDNG
jgi:hypothetical protein